MRNLKRALSLVMAMALIVGMMVVSASAVSSDFTDNDEIDHKEAVNVMVTLNVIDGKEDGSYYDPDGSLTRAEMAKIVAYVMNGGVEPVVGTKLVPTYSDIKGHWAEKYIEYCTSMGIIAGDGAGKFNPGGTLTGEQAAKMFLTAMGYNANVFGFVGNDWAINVGRYANEAGLYDELGDITPSATITRDDAAQMAYNAIQATMMERTWQQDMTTGQLTETYRPWVDTVSAPGGGSMNVNHTLLVDKFDGNVYEGVLSATGEYDLTAVLGSNDGLANSDGFVVTVDHINGTTQTPAADRYFEYEDQDLTALMGQYVKVLYNSKTETVYGVYAVAGKNNVLETAASKTDYTGLTNKVKVDGVTYNLESDIIYVYDEGVGTKAQTSNLQSADKVVYVDNDGNGKFDVALVTPVDVAKVTFLNATNITFAPVKNNATQNGNAQLVENVVLSEGLAQNDYAILTPSYYADADTLTEVAVASGNVSGVRNPVTPGTAPYNDYQIGDAWYKVAISGGTVANSSIKSGSAIDYVAVNGVIFYAKLTSGATLGDVAVIYSMAHDGTDVFGNQAIKAKVMFSDGSTKEVTVDALYANSASTTNEVNFADGGTYHGMNTESTYIGVLLSYKINNDGNYEFYKLGTGTNDRAGMDLFDDAGLGVTAASNGDLRISGTGKSYLVADDAIIVVRNAAATMGDANSDNKLDANSLNDKITYVTGGDFKKLAAGKFETTGASVLVGKDADGFSRVMFAIVQATTEAGAGNTTKGYNTTDAKFNLGTGTGSSFGYMTKNSWTETIDGSNYNCFEIWDGSNTITVKAKDTAAQYYARSIIRYDVVGDGIVKNVTVGGSSEGSITAYNDSSVEIDGTSYSITGDTVILNVKDEEKVGVSGSALLNATEIGSTGSFVKNARYITNARNEVLVIVVDVNNELVSASGNVSVSGTGLTAATLTEILGAVDSVEVTGVLTLTGNVTIPAGKTLTLGGATNTGSYSFVGGGTLNVPTGASLDRTTAVSTKVTLNSSTLNVALPAPTVVIGSHVGNIGTSEDNSTHDMEFDIPGTCNGAGIYQFDFSGLGYVQGTSTVAVSRTSPDAASVLTLKSADDLAIHFNSTTGNTLYIVYDADGAGATDSITFTVTYPGA